MPASLQPVPPHQLCFQGYAMARWYCTDRSSIADCMLTYHPSPWCWWWWCQRIHLGFAHCLLGKTPSDKKGTRHCFLNWTTLHFEILCVELFCFRMLSPEIQILRSTYLQWVPWLAIFAKNTLRSKSLAPISCQVGLGFGDAESETWQQAVIHGIPSSIPGVDSVRWCCTKVSLADFWPKMRP